MLRNPTFKVIATCEACVAPIKKIIFDTNLSIKDEDIQITLETANSPAKVRVTYLTKNPDEDKTEEIIRNALRDGCRLIEDEAPNDQNKPNTELTITSAPPSTPNQADTKPTIKRKPRWLSILLGVIGVASGAALMALMLSGVGIPFALMAGLGITSAVVSLGLGAETIYNAGLHFVKSRTLNMDTLYALGGLIAIGVTIGHLFLPGIFPMIFDAALLIFGFKHIGDAVKGSFLNTTSTEANFSDRINTIIALDAAGQKIALENIPVGSIIRVPRGSIIPIDGEILDDDAVIYQTLLNGKTSPKMLSKGEAVLSGFRIDDKNKNEFVRIKTTATLNDSYLKQLDLRLAQEKKLSPQASSIKDKILPWFIPVVLTLAVVAALAMGIAFLPALGTAAVAIGIKCLIGVLVSACPCTLGLVIPSLTNAGVEKTKTANLILKDDKCLQTAARITGIGFDLNGTITLGKPVVKSFFSPMLPERFLGYAKAAEKDSPHQKAQAIFDFCSRNKTFDYQTTHITQHRTGVRTTVTTVQNTEILVGNADLMKENNMDVEKYKNENKIKISKLQQLTYMSFGNKIVGHFVLEDPIKPGTLALIRKLKSLGYKIYLFTGDDDDTAQPYAEAVEIDPKNVYANCKNVAKKSDGDVRTKPGCIKLLQDKQGEVIAMVGDAGNDAIAMLTSHLGIAVKSPSSDDMTLSMASVVIEDGSLTPILALFEAAKQTETQIKNSLITSLSLNGLVIATTIAGVALTALGIFFPPAIGAGLMVLSLGPIAVFTAYLKNQKLEAYEEVKAEANKGVDTLELMNELDQQPGREPQRFPSPLPSPALTAAANSYNLGRERELRSGNSVSSSGNRDNSAPSTASPLPPFKL